MSNKILILHDKEDSHFFDKFYLGFYDLKNDYNLEIESYELILNIENLKKNILDDLKLEDIKQKIEDSSIVLIFISPETIASVELSLLFNKNENLFDRKHLAFVIIRLCSWESCEWIDDGYIQNNYSLISSLEKPDIDQIILETNIEIKKIFDLKSKTLDNDSKPFRIFISYSHKDGYFADLLKYKLLENKFEVSLDIDYLIAGKNWKSSIDYKIENCDVLLLVYSENARNSDYVSYEWAYAMGKGKEVIPILIENDVKLQHPKLAELQAFEGLVDRANQNWEGLNDVINSFITSLE